MILELKVYSDIFLIPALIFFKVTVLSRPDLRGKLASPSHVRYGVTWGPCTILEVPDKSSPRLKARFYPSNTTHFRDPQNDQRRSYEEGPGRIRIVFKA